MLEAEYYRAELGTTSIKVFETMMALFDFHFACRAQS